MINKRLKPYYNKSGKEFEYFLESKQAWMTKLELVKEAKKANNPITFGCIGSRLSNSGNNPDFDTVDGCIYTPPQQNRNKTGYKEKREFLTSEFYDFLGIMNSMPITSCSFDSKGLK